MQQNLQQEGFKKELSDKGTKKLSRKNRRGKKSAGAFQTISEVASILGVQQHVLRFWESKFPQVKPLKRGGGRRYYRPEDVKLLQYIQHLLHDEGYTIKGVQKLLRSTRGNLNALDKKLSDNGVSTSKDAEVKDSSKIRIISDEKRAVLQAMLDELKSMRSLLDV